MELSACLELLFAEQPDEPFERRVGRAADAGFGAVEVWGWRDKDLDALRGALLASGVSLLSMIVDPKIPLVDPARRPEFLAAVRESVDVAVRLGRPFLVVVSGDEIPGVARDAQHQSIVDALRAAAPRAEVAGVAIVLENLNTRVDHVGQYLDSAIEALDIVDEVGSPAVGMLYDLYHSVVMGEDPASVIGSRIDRVRHVQVADVPGRHEPGTGTIDWQEQLGWLAGNGYRGRIGLEYWPSTPTIDSLRHIRSVADGLTA